MIIRELEVTNVRSHGHSLIRFPLGKTLLEGDIGSGKSSVLIAIEFALFGLGSDSGSSVLKLGEDSGEVRMDFEVDGSAYEVVRRLVRRSGRVQQADGFLRTPGETLNLSPSELKEKVLEILEFNEAPDPKAQSWIYRYAVYTPQEEMKGILMLAPEQRLQILRRAFRVEDYKTAATNAEEAARQVRVDASRLEGVSEGIDGLKRDMEELEREEEEHEARVDELGRTVSRSEEDVVAARAEREEVQKLELGLRETGAERDYYERQRSDAARDAAELEDEVSGLREELAKAEAFLRESGGSKAPRPLAGLRRQERSLEAKAKRLTGMKAAVESKLSDYQSIMEKGVCPVCDRPVEARDFERKKTMKDAERRHVSDELHSTESSLVQVRKEMEKAEAHAELKKDIARRRTERSRLKAEVAKKETSRKKFEKREAFAKVALQRLEKRIRELEHAAERGAKASDRLVEAEAALKRAGEELVKEKERLGSVRERQEKIAAEVATKEEASKKGRALREREIWLGDYFVPTIKVVEKSVLATINQEFDSLFKRWFGMLVSDPDKEVSVDEDFTPVVSQGGYEQDVRYLSGGERTSVALAYRLALNVLAQRVSAGMKSNMLILDEPTDGFSKEQLGNVREVLDEIGCPQVIFVSHDKELESFADQIFKIDKAGSDSVVKAPQ